MKRSSFTLFVFALFCVLSLSSACHAQQNNLWQDMGYVIDQMLIVPNPNNDPESVLVDWTATSSHTRTSNTNITGHVYIATHKDFKWLGQQGQPVTSLELLENVSCNGYANQYSMPLPSSSASANVDPGNVVGGCYPPGMPMAFGASAKFDTIFDPMGQTTVTRTLTVNTNAANAVGEAFADASIALK